MDTQAMDVLTIPSLYDDITSIISNSNRREKPPLLWRWYVWSPEKNIKTTRENINEHTGKWDGTGLEEVRLLDYWLCLFVDNLQDCSFLCRMRGDIKLILQKNEYMSFLQGQRETKFWDPSPKSRITHPVATLTLPASNTIHKSCQHQQSSHQDRTCSIIRWYKATSALR